MATLDHRTRVNMDFVLENACKVLSRSGGDHESRKSIAMKLLQAAENGHTTLDDLETIARQAMQELTRKKST